MLYLYFKLLLTLLALVILSLTAANAQPRTTLYVANFWNEASICTIAPDGTVNTFVRGVPNPNGLAFDSQGNLFATNAYTGTITKITRERVITTFVTGLQHPNKLVIDSSDNLYTINDRTTILRITPSGTVTTFATSTTPLYSLAFDSAGNLYAVDHGDNANITKFTPSGQVVNNLHSQIGNHVGDMIFGSNDTLYYTHIYGRISRIPLNGTQSLFVHQEGLGGDGLAFDGNGNLYTTHPDWIHKITPDGTVTLFASFDFGGLVGANRIVFGPAPLPVPSALYTISGTVLLQSAVNRVQSVDFTFRSATGSAFTRTATLSAAGDYRLLNIPAEQYTLSVKGVKWLRKNISIDARLGNVTNANTTLLAGDANGDNFADIEDLLLLIRHYNQAAPNAGFLDAADFNCDGINDIADLLLLIGNYNKQGDP